MSHMERMVIGTFISVACAWSFFVLGWWVSASLSIYHVFPISDMGIAVAALAGLGLGILLDVLYLKGWVKRFYNLDWRLAATLYMYWLVLATASFMGLPAGTLLLGIMAGIYLGRRHSHSETSPELFSRKATAGSMLIALATASSAFGVGVLALRDRYILAAIGDAVGTSTDTGTLLAGAAMLVVLCPLLAVLQYWSTRTAATFAFNWRKPSGKASAASGTRV